jgi:hypothetical protein
MFEIVIIVLFLLLSVLTVVYTCYKHRYIYRKDFIPIHTIIDDEESDFGDLDETKL